MQFVVFLLLVAILAVGALYAVQSGSLIRLPFAPAVLHRIGYNGVATLTGTVTEGPIMPVCVNTKPCFRVLGDRQIDAEDTDNTIVASTTTDANGMYTLYLAPGTYRLTSSPSIGLKASQPVTVHAGTNHFDLRFETSIR